MSGTRWVFFAVVAHLPQDYACCGFTNPLLHTSAVTSVYIRQSCSSISLNQLANSPLTSSINNAAYWKFFPFHTVLCKPLVVHENPSN